MRITSSIGIIKIFSVPYSACFSRFGDNLDSLSHKLIRDYNFDLNLRDKIDNILGTSIKFSVSFLSAETLYFADSDTSDTYLSKLFLNVV